MERKTRDKEHTKNHLFHVILESLAELGSQHKTAGSFTSFENILFTSQFQDMVINDEYFFNILKKCAVNNFFGSRLCIL